MRRSLREMNPVPVGVIGTVVVVAVIIAALNISRLPLPDGATTYQAAFSEAGGLEPGDEVHIAGAQVGTVTEVGLDGAHVEISFRVEGGTKLGRTTRAAIKVATPLGAKFLALFPSGRDQLSGPIPLSRTDSPYDLTEALAGVTQTVGKIDVDQLATALDTLSNTFDDTPAEVQSALQGLSRVSTMIASRDQQLRTLLAHARAVTDVVASRNQELKTLLVDGDKLMTMLQRRRAVIHQLLVNANRMSTQLTALVEENQQQLEPALQHLNDIIAVLRRNQHNLKLALKRAGPFVKELGEAVSQGPWFEFYLAGLTSPVQQPSLWSKTGEP